MPEMYDPYSTDRLSPSAWDIAGEMVNPVSLLKYKYMMDPGVWSPSRGIWSPMDLAKTKGIIGDIGKIYKDKGVLKGTAGAAKRVGSVFSLKGTYFGENYFQRVKDVSTFRSNIQSRMFDYFRDVTPDKIFYGGKEGLMFSPVSAPKLGARKAHHLSKIFRNEIMEWADEAGDVSRLTAGALRERIASRVGTASFIKKYGLLNADDITSKIIPTKGGRKAVAKLIQDAGVTKHIGKLTASGPGLARLAKGGLFAAKGLAMVGLVSTMWDLTQMVAEPIGRTLVQGANRVATAYENRFMPEMGGRLAMSYMTTGAATERQRAVQAISKAYINGRSAYGAEAALQHS